MSGYLVEIRRERSKWHVTDAFVPDDVAKQLVRLRIGKQGNKGKLTRDIRPCIGDDREHVKQYGWLEDVAVHGLPPVYEQASLVLVGFHGRE